MNYYSFFNKMISLFRQIAIDLYQHNLLVKNQLMLNGQVEEEKEGTEPSQIRKTAVDLKNITMPVLNIVGDKDDLVSSRTILDIHHYMKRQSAIY